MKYRVVEQWRPNGGEICILYLDNEKIISSKDDDYRNYSIDGVIYKPVPMSHIKKTVKAVAIQGKGNFVGKEVEFIKEDA